jgi:hypothetical protein
MKDEEVCGNLKNSRHTARYYLNDSNFALLNCRRMRYNHYYKKYVASSHFSMLRPYP